jgi:hypothetical protein
MRSAMTNRSQSLLVGEIVRVRSQEPVVRR